MALFPLPTIMTRTPIRGDPQATPLSLRRFPGLPGSIPRVRPAHQKEILRWRFTSTVARRTMSR